MDSHSHMHSGSMASHHSAMQEECDGSIDPSAKGSWKGHILPGAVFILWGCYWAYHACIYHVWVSPRRPYRARAWYPLPLPLCRLAEPILKLVVPLVAVSMELYFDHPDGYRYLYCPAGTRHANRFALTHVNNWQHAAVYPAFLLAGAVDLLSHWVALPPGSSHAVLAVAYAVMAFLMGTHEKHEPQDKMVHWLLFVAMLLCLAFLLVEMHAPCNPLSSLGKAGAVILLGAWFVQIGRIEFETHPQWSSGYRGGAMLAPVVFCTIAVGVVAGVVTLYMVLSVLHASQALRFSPLPPPDRHDSLLDGKHAAVDVFSEMEMQRLNPPQAGSQDCGLDSVCDSAISSSSGSPGATVVAGRSPFRMLNAAAYAHSPGAL